MRRNTGSILKVITQCVHEITICLQDRILTHVTNMSPQKLENTFRKVAEELRRDIVGIHICTIQN